MAGILALAISIKMNHTLTFLDINIPVSGCIQVKTVQDVLMIKLSLWMRN